MGADWQVTVLMYGIRKLQPTDTVKYVELNTDITTGFETEQTAFVK
jgi:hypothetical protein